MRCEYETGTAMNARASENYMAISRSSSASKSVEIFWAEIYWGQLFFFQFFSAIGICLINCLSKSNKNINTTNVIEP
jgi:hypothetical protein